MELQLHFLCLCPLYPVQYFVCSCKKLITTTQTKTCLLAFIFRWYCDHYFSTMLLLSHLFCISLSICYLFCHLQLQNLPNCIIMLFTSYLLISMYSKGATVDVQKVDRLWKYSSIWKYPQGMRCCFCPPSICYLPFFAL